MSHHFLIVAETKEGGLKKISLEMLGAATRLGQKIQAPVDAIIIGSGVSKLADELAQYGARRVYVADDPKLEKYSSEGYAYILANFIKRNQPNVVFLGATSFGKDLGPKVAAKLGVGLASDCTALDIQDNKLIITRPIYAGKAIATVRCKEVPQMATLRPNVFPPLDRDPSRKAEVENISTETGDIRAIVKEVVKEAGAKVELTEADIIVTGGRGMKGPEGFKILEDLAKVLGAAVGASRAAVDAGWRPHSDQVGQTGKVVSPKLYIACGVSGAIQHLAGMSTSKVIVAINKDPDAPIFNVADYGIVDDLFKVVPIMTEEFKKLLSE